MTLPTSKAALILFGGVAPAVAQQADSAQNAAEPAGFFLLVLGLAALLLGMRNLRELRHKRMMPPRPDQVRSNTPEADPHPHQD